MEKGLCIGSMAVAGLLLLVFLLDLLLGFPFSRAGGSGFSSPYSLVDICGILGSGILGYLAFNAYQDVK
ncbi:hypothetical protein KIH39_12730 [Telmatocola sphagniphila]|jgi:hypothetical protein|uniref:Uncharacterized protein n=1 Tax=Telmatocola sphagniphila TaxID=1123043 RepID=A0A8E6EXC3_9BACT|nr:hypothetical protein [Telmatocola sphagniphila]QVL34732.1 hypothetical protein KIH39_12730 [Telmatocola sphagniphila]